MVVNNRMMSAPHTLTKQEVGRYSRQLLVGEFGVHGQESLLSSRVLIVGAGGLGCPCATYLAGAGVGTIGIVDFDTVAIDNLHRQIGHSERNIGKNKAESLKETLNRCAVVINCSLNSAVTVICHHEAIDRHNGLKIVEQYDVVVDCSDNPATRYLINDACVLMKKPLVSGSALRWEGQLTVYNYGETCPCYRCVFPVPPSPNLVTNCSEGGVLGPVVGVIGSLQALEVIKIISNAASTYAGELLLFDGKTGRINVVALRKKSPKCSICSERPQITELVDYEVFCGSGIHDKVIEQHLLKEPERLGVVQYALLRKTSGLLAFYDHLSSVPEGPPPLVESPEELSSLVHKDERVIKLIDVRPPHEFAIGRLPEAINIPMDRLRNMTMEEVTTVLKLDENKGDEDDIVFLICHRGNDSQLAVRLLQKLFAPRPSLTFKDIIGGYHEWADIVDPNFPQY